MIPLFNVPRVLGNLQALNYCHKGQKFWVKCYRTYTSTFRDLLDACVRTHVRGRRRKNCCKIIWGPFLPPCDPHALTQLTNSLEFKPSNSYKKGGALTQIFSVFACTSLLICTLGRSPCPLEALLPYLTLTLKEILSFPLVGQLQLFESFLVILNLVPRIDLLLAIESQQ